MFLCPSASLRENELSEVAIEHARQRWHLIVARLGGRAAAWLNVCPHMGRSLSWAPDRFLRDQDGHLVCAAHGAVFELTQGRCVAGPCKGAALTAVELFERGGSVYARLEDNSPGRPLP